VQTNTEPATASFTETIIGRGVLVGPSGSVPIAHVTMRRTKYATDESWELKAFLAAGDADAASRLLDHDRPRRALRIECETDRGEQFVVSETLLMRLRGRELSLEVSQFDYGRPELLERPTNQWAFIELSATEFARSMPEDQRNKLEPMRWTCEIGTFLLERYRTPETVLVSGQTYSLTTTQVVLHGVIAEDFVTSRPRELIDQLQEEIRSFLSILNLLERRTVMWSDIRIDSAPHGTADYVRSSCGRWRVAPESTRPEFLYAIVSPRAVPSDYLDRMARSFRTIPRWRRLAAAIAFLNSARRAHYLEERVIASSIAFEATVRALPSSHESGLETEEDAGVRVITEGILATLGVPPSWPGVSAGAAVQVVRRLTEMTNPSLAREAVQLIARYGVEWSDLWLRETSLERALKATLWETRHRLFHTGELPGGFAAAPEAERLQILAERLIFRALGGSVEELTPKAFGQIEWIHRELAELRGAPAGQASESPK
jgi:hypothetical protein